MCECDINVGSLGANNRAETGQMPQIAPGVREVPENENPFFRTVHTYVIRAGRMTCGERKNYAELKSAWCIPFERRTLSVHDIFGNTNPLTIEIGFGMGHATSLIAEQHPDMNYIGIEVHVPGVGRLLGDINQKQLKNLYIIEHDALDVLDCMVADNSVQAFHVFFPDPWPKKKHHKRRLMQRPHTDVLAAKLVPGGTIYFVTDWKAYAEQALSELSDTPKLHNRYESFAEPQTWRPRTKFEQKGLNAGRVIHELVFEKRED